VVTPPDIGLIRGLRVIDSHAHIWSQRDIPLLVEEVRRLGITAACVSCLADWDWSTAPDPGAGNDLVFRTATENPEIFGYVYVDPTQPEEAMAQIDRYLHHPSLVGIKLWISCRANDRRVNPIAERAVEKDLILLVHAWRRGTPLSKGYQTLPTEVAELAASFPELTVIMAHIGGDWETGASEVADVPNVLVDTCGTINESGMIENAVQTLGARRVVFGSDAPGSGFLPNLGKVLSAEITEAEKSMILRGNMERLLKGKRGLDLGLDGKGER